MKYFFRILVSIILVSGIFSNVLASYQESVDVLMDNYYLKIDNNSTNIDSKITTLEILQSKIIKLKEIKSANLSTKNEEILMLIIESLDNKIDTYKGEKNYIETNAYQLTGLENWDIVAIMNTNKWEIKIKLFVEEVPITTLNFIWHTQNGYYDDLIFHRVINNFMIQWWDPSWNGTGWESIYWWKFDDEFSEKLSNIQWSISMANAWENTNWSQFFINHADNTFLDYNKYPTQSKHAVFGQVIEWMDIVNQIAETEVNIWTNKPLEDIIINTITIKEYNNWKYSDSIIDIEKEIELLEIID